MRNLQSSQPLRPSKHAQKASLYEAVYGVSHELHCLFKKYGGDFWDEKDFNTFGRVTTGLLGRYCTPTWACNVVAIMLLVQSNIGVAGILLSCSDHHSEMVPWLLQSQVLPQHCCSKAVPADSFTKKCRCYHLTPLLHSNASTALLFVVSAPGRSM